MIREGSRRPDVLVNVGSYEHAAIRTVDVVVIGAGQAGLTSAYHLRRMEPHREYVVLDNNPGPGGAWRQRWPSLRFGGVHGIHNLPGLPMAETGGHQPAAEVVSEYFDRYEHIFDLPVQRPVNVRSVSHGVDDHLIVDTDAGRWMARAVINATGTWQNPFWPHYPGRSLFAGRQLHTADYRTADEFQGQRVLVVGGGISAIELLSELSEVATTTWVTRRPPAFTEQEFSSAQGRAAVAEVQRRVRAGLPPGSIVSATGLPLTPAIRLARERGVLNRLPMFNRITERGVAWLDGSEIDLDAILWATGFRSAIGHLAPLRIREAGGGIRVEGTRVVAEPRLHLVGYGPSASTIGANRAGRAAVHEIHTLLRNQLANAG